MPSTDSTAASTLRQSKVYKLVVTPIVFVSFLLSLAWVEFRYSLLRSHTYTLEDRSNATSAPSLAHRMPAWLHRIIYRRQIYQYVKVTHGHDGHHENENEHEENDRSQPFYYHSMQRKLLKMETEEAFRIRSTVLCVIGLVLAGMAWAASLIVRWTMLWLWT